MPRSRMLLVGFALLPVLASATSPQFRWPGWPAYLDHFMPPDGMTWSWYRVSAKDGMPQVLVPGAHPFWMDLHAVTVGQYRRYCQATGGPAGDLSTRPELAPVCGLSLEEAQAYARWAGRRLPTASQAELVHSAPTTGCQGGTPFLVVRWKSDMQGSKLVVDEISASGIGVVSEDYNPMADPGATRGAQPMHPLGLYGMAGGVGELDAAGRVHGGAGTIRRYQLHPAASVVGPVGTGFRLANDAPGPSRALPHAVVARSLAPLAAVRWGAATRPRPSRAARKSDAAPPPRTVSGVGPPPAGGSREWRLRQALWIARLDAWRSLGEGVGGMPDNPSEGVVRALVGREEVGLAPDGVVRVGALGRAEWLSAKLLGGGMFKAAADEGPTEDQINGPATATVKDPDRPVTGVIVDGRGFRLMASMNPALVRADGSVVWSAKNAPPEFVVEHGVVGWVTSPAQGKRAGNNPMTITAIGKHGSFDSDPILNNADAAKLLAADKQDHFLAKYAVVIVKD
ncbi:MAG: SUMF1/EgtB/PvdO family nonheme iron enzyme [Armatimonadetes bacterium]|nr:SUMF1/EgtB/PvdO family nonheme iron enzyme [Armatimonadota bacterium]